MKKLLVYAELKGIRHLVGTICGNGPDDAVFRYEESYLADPKAAPVSVSLPLTEKTYSPLETRTFFEGLLPEGFTRRSVAHWMHADAEDYVSILMGLGRECLGALQLLPEGAEEIEPSYEPISDHQVAALAREGATTSAQIVTKTHLSLTGASGKVGLYYDSGKGVWYLPKGTAPSTHIVKQSHVRLNGIVANEQLCLLTARKLGIRVPESFVINLGHGNDEEVLFATERYDRRITPDSVLISGLPAPMRLHQEDFAQALGMSSASKYEDLPKHYLRQMFTLLRSCSSDPINDQLMLWDALVFDFLIGNADAHLKNVSLLYNEDMTSKRLAPLYDIVSTSVYESGTRDMAVFFGGKCSLDEISRSDIMAAADEAGLGRRMAIRRLDALCEHFEEALNEAAVELEPLEPTLIARLRSQILATGGYIRICG